MRKPSQPVFLGQQRTTPAIWEMFGDSGSQRWSESKDAQMDDFNAELFSFISSMQEEGSSDGLDGGGTALNVE